MRISDWRSDVCSSDLQTGDIVGHVGEQLVAFGERESAFHHLAVERDLDVDLVVRAIDPGRIIDEIGVDPAAALGERDPRRLRSEEHTSELQSLMRISYAVFCLKKQNITIS